MASVFLVALVLAAVEVCREKSLHVHTGVYVRGRQSGTVQRVVPSPFWPRYARRLLGRPWRRQPVCRPRPGSKVGVWQALATRDRGEVFGGDAY